MFSGSEEKITTHDFIGISDKYNHDDSLPTLVKGITSLSKDAIVGLEKRNNDKVLYGTVTNLKKQQTLALCVDLSKREVDIILKNKHPGIACLMPFVPNGVTLKPADHLQHLNNLKYLAKSITREFLLLHQTLMEDHLNALLDNLPQYGRIMLCSNISSKHLIHIANKMNKLIHLCVSERKQLNILLEHMPLESCLVLLFSIHAFINNALKDSIEYKNTLDNFIYAVSNMKEGRMFALPVDMPLPEVKKIIPMMRPGIIFMCGRAYAIPEVISLMPKGTKLFLPWCKDISDIFPLLEYMPKDVELALDDYLAVRFTFALAMLRASSSSRDSGPLLLQSASNISSVPLSLQDSSAKNKKKRPNQSNKEKKEDPKGKSAKKSKPQNQLNSHANSSAPSTYPSQLRTIDLTSSSTLSSSPSTLFAPSVSHHSSTFDFVESSPGLYQQPLLSNEAKNLSDNNSSLSLLIDPLQQSSDELRLSPMPAPSTLSHHSLSSFSPPQLGNDGVSKELDDSWLWDGIAARTPSSQIIFDDLNLSLEDASSSCSSSMLFPGNGRR